jgi:hypothetical protein
VEDVPDECEGSWRRECGRENCSLLFACEFFFELFFWLVLGGSGDEVRVNDESVSLSELFLTGLVMRSRKLLLLCGGFLAGESAVVFDLTLECKDLVNSYDWSVSLEFFLFGFDLDTAPLFGRLNADDDCVSSSLSESAAFDEFFFLGSKRDMFSILLICLFVYKFYIFY